YIPSYEVRKLRYASICIMQGETAKGGYPLECIRTMANICKEAEAAIWQTQIFHDLSSKTLPPIDATHAVAIASVEASVKYLASAIIVITTSGRSAHLIAKYRPSCPIIAITRFHQVARQAHLYRGILPLYYEDAVKMFEFTVTWQDRCSSVITRREIARGLTTSTLAGGPGKQLTGRSEQLSTLYQLNRLVPKL
ncbi:PREDICTED: pyruvate kinase-like, partial [Acromyrmex echinatior]|uniref:pyruvate kinase-like n=1 Tax=Acromyrmex echinatior TaxID=103372 RepID=UPI000580C49B